MDLSNKKILYYCDDTNLSPIYDCIEEKLEHEIIKPLIKLGVTLNRKNVKCTEFSPFKKKFYYDILFIDYGGIFSRNSSINHLCQFLIEEAINNPSIVYVIKGSSTKNAILDAINMLLDEEKPNNIYYGISDFLSNYSK